MALLLIEANATVTVCHSRTQNIGDVVRGADIGTSLFLLSLTYH